MATARIEAINQAIHSWAAHSDTRQADLARKAGVSRNAVSNWYRGQVTPGREHWAVIEEHFDQPGGTLARLASAAYRSDSAPDLVVALKDGTILTIEVKAGSAQGERLARDTIAKLGTTINRQFAIAADGSKTGRPPAGGVKRSGRPQPTPDQGEHVND